VEAVREGMEDARILIALKARLADPSVSMDAKEKIRRLVDVALPAVAGQSTEEVRIGAARYVIDATNNDATVNGLRNALLECVEAVERGGQVRTGSR